MPWTAPVNSLVLFRKDLRWAFALNSESGIIDGHLIDLEDGVPLEVAQAAIIQKVEEITGHSYVAVWSPYKPDWWSAELAPADA